MNKKRSKIFLFVLLSILSLGFTTKLNAQETSNDTKFYAINNSAKLGDEVEIKLIINYNSKLVHNFQTDITFSDGIEYVDDSVYILNVTNGTQVATEEFQLQTQENNINVSAGDIKSKTYVINFDVLITEEFENYQITANTIYNNQSPETISTNINKREAEESKSQIKITNKSVSNKVIAQARFAIYKDGEKVETIVTNDKGVALSSKLPPGNYKIVQEALPNQYAENFEEKSVVIMNNSDDFIDVEYTNEEAGGQFVIEALDQKERAIPYEHIIITDENGNEKNYVTGIDGKVETEKIPIGNYAIKYIEGDETQNVSILSNGEVENVTFNRFVNYGKVKVFAKNTSGMPIANHHYTLEDEDGNIIDELVTDENGYAESDTIEYGDYVLVDSETGQEINFTVEKGTVNVQITYGSQGNTNQSKPSNNTQSEEKIEDETQPEEDIPKEIVSYEIENTSNTKLIILVIVVIVAIVVGVLVVRKVLLGKSNITQ